MNTRARARARARAGAGRRAGLGLGLELGLGAGLEAEEPPSCPRSVVTTPGASSSEVLLPPFLVAFVLVIVQ